MLSRSIAFAIVLASTSVLAGPKDGKKGDPKGEKKPPPEIVIEDDHVDATDDKDGGGAGGTGEGGDDAGGTAEGDRMKVEPPVEDKPAQPLPPAAAPPAASGIKFSWTPFGFLRMQYRMVQDDPNVVFIGRDDGFEMQNARLGVRGVIPERAAFVVSFDGVIDERAALNTPDGHLRVQLRDGFLDAGIAGRTVLRGGYFQTWVDPEAQIVDVWRLFVDRPIETRGVRPTEGYQRMGLMPQRSMGVALRVDRAPAQVSNPIQVQGEPVPGVAFELAAQNGAEEFASSNDNNLPALSASVLGRFGTEGFVVGSVRYNPRTINEIPALQDENDLQGTFGFQVAGGPALINAAATVINTTFPTAGTPSRLALGGHAQLAFRTTGAYPLAVGYRFGFFDPDNRLTFDRVMEHTAGITVGVPALRMRLQAQITHVTEQAPSSLSNSRLQLAAEVSL